ncbi:MAG: hypothetical protein RL562_928 [Planctomycetota bacterium]|jgi:hypothetical protein
MTERTRVPGPVLIFTILGFVAGLGYLIYAMVTAGSR